MSFIQKLQCPDRIIANKNKDLCYYAISEEGELLSIDVYSIFMGNEWKSTIIFNRYGEIIKKSDSYSVPIINLRILSKNEITYLNVKNTTFFLLNTETTVETVICKFNVPPKEIYLTTDKKWLIYTDSQISNLILLHINTGKEVIIAKNVKNFTCIFSLSKVAVSYISKKDHNCTI